MEVSINGVEQVGDVERVVDDNLVIDLVDRYLKGFVGHC